MVGYYGTLTASLVAGDEEDPLPTWLDAHAVPEVQTELLPGIDLLLGSEPTSETQLFLREFGGVANVSSVTAASRVPAARLAIVIAIVKETPRSGKLVPPAS